MSLCLRLWHAVCFLILLATASAAQQTPVALAEYERARSAMLSDISDPEKAFDFAQAAVAVGDVRGAIDALERVLTLNPTLTNIRFELGLLYLRAGSPELAQSYLLDVLADADTPMPIRSRAEELIQEIETRQARNLFSGSLSASVRHDSNANLAPDRLLVGGIPFNVSSVDDSTSDFSAVFAAELQHLYDLGGQFGPFIETDLTLFSQTYQDVSTSDIFFLRVDSGPRYRLGLDGDHSLRPYLGASTLYLGQELYGHAALIGLEYSHALDARNSIRAEVSSRWQNLFNSDVNPTAERFEGRQISGRLGYRRSLTERLSADIALSLTDSDYDARFESNFTTGLEVGLYQSVGNFFNASLDPAVLSFSAGYALADYDAANPEVDPDTEQEDDRWRIGLAMALPISENFLLDAGVNYARNDSNLPNDDYDNLQVSLGVRYNFRRSR